MSFSEPIWPLSVERYHRMIEVGILTSDDPVELLEGLLIARPRKSPQHRGATRLLTHRLERLTPATWWGDIHGAFTTDTSEPEPDVCVVRGDCRHYLHRHPWPEDLGMIVEVADATLSRDRTTKKRIYARAQIPVYWIVNLIERQVEVYTGPADEPDYRQRRDDGPAESVPVVLDGQKVGQIPVGELLP